MSKTFQVVLSCTLLVGIASCASPSNKPEQKSNLTMGTVKSQIEKGKTNQAEIIKLLGSPNITTKNRQNDEVWTYSRQSTDSESGAHGWSAIFAGSNKAFSSTASSTFDLIITFDKNDVVKDYSVVSSQF